MKRQMLIIISNRKKNNDNIKLEIFINPTEVCPHLAHLCFYFAAGKNAINLYCRQIKCVLLSMFFLNFLQKLTIAIGFP